MSGADNTPETERGDAIIAAEYALGLLEGEELLSARGKAASDANFAAQKDWWDAQLAPLTDEVAGMEPGADVWERISARINGGAIQNGAEVIDLQSRLRRWKWTAGFTSAAAAVLAAVMVLGPGSGPNDAPPTDGTPQLAAANPLVAQVPIGDTGLRLDVTYVPQSEQMLIGAIGLTADGVHDHELWLVPADGSEVQSLGVVAPGEVLAMELPEDVSRNLGDGVQILLTREPIGGKPEGVDPGPVVAQGAFSQV